MNISKCERFRDSWVMGELQEERMQALAKMQGGGSEWKGGGRKRRKRFY